ncbi:hypothetical protein PV749_10625 [Streptomyces sp. ID03-2B]|uniref:hypothetical protein n=1 Tax=Streptomyces sp. ID03-2B TaxID=3028660 RepID=UPI0029B3C81D|nr:hypothetical protein [Streptomyces sp. ID03-2B]MDX3591578.1 hypothetical protein [Streptomyces sp. ID03-2B]
MSEEATISNTHVFDDTEEEAIRLLAKFKISLWDAGEGHINFSPYEKMTSRRENQVPRFGVSLPRKYLPDLRDQLLTGVSPHSTSRGIVAPAAGYVEMVVQYNRIPGGTNYQLRRATVSSEMTCRHIEDGARIPTLRREDHTQTDLHIAGNGTTCVEISPPSPACYALTAYGMYAPKEANRLRSFGPTVKVYLESDKPDRLEKTAGQVVSSLLYELDVRNSIRFHTDRWPAERGDRGILRRRAATSVIRFPEISIKPELATLFGFADSARGNPPLAFLTYYQILEHNLASAVKRRALSKMAKELSDPLFNRSSRDDLLRIFMISERSTHMSEAAQLRTLIDECVRPEALTDFFATGDYLSHFGNKGPIAGVETVNPSNPKFSLASQVADRVYGIRNRIVHAKDDPRYGEAPPLLPEGPEADALWPDIVLARLLATEVILDGHAGT